ncbi:MAG TPA: alpha/beta hydrolase fold domain-containing protein [Clostridiales bacterium]|nr:alpha/beta hydrolase fold domain-containing protein [Clostridiales bacterium]
MKLSTKFVRAQLELMRPFIQSRPLEFSRSRQDRLGRIMQATKKQGVVALDIELDALKAAWILPRDELRTGVILYLHGGGYTCGTLDYARGFASVLAESTGMRVFCPAYRLAPEHPYPAALADAYSAYKFLLEEGYDSKQIVLCGESAGGGLIYSLCYIIRDTKMPQPAGLIAISPWTDLTLSGKSYITNQKTDPSMSVERLEFFADCYTGRRYDLVEGIEKPWPAPTDKNDPYVSPLLGNLRGLPPSLIFAGGDEIMLDDAALMHKRLLLAGVASRLIVTPHMWHAYVLFCFEEHKSDFDEINNFIKSVLPRGSERKLKWLKLDNAAKIYPAAATKRWSNVFRLSATLKEEVDRDQLQSALDITVRRFPSIAVRLRRGLFWYYLEEVPRAPRIMDEKSYPLSHMPFDDIRKCAFRVLLYRRRIAVEFFHAVTDGNGGLVFLKTLVAEYLSGKYGTKIPKTDGVLDRLQPPSNEEFEDSFQKYAGKIKRSRREANSFKLQGTPETDGFHNITTFILDLSEVLAAAKQKKVTITSYLAAAMILAGIRLQNETGRPQKKQKPVKILIPVNLRNLFPSKSLRNFVFYVTPGVDPRLGEYTFGEICVSIQHQLGLFVTPNEMASRISGNVQDERLLVLKLTPLFIKNIVMKIMFSLFGERKSMMSLSNLGVIKVPDAMREQIERFDFVLGAQSTSPYNCGVLSYGDKLIINIIRNIKEPLLERRFYEVLREQNIPVKVESNQR